MTNRFIERLEAFQLADEAFEELADDEAGAHSRAFERRHRALMALMETKLKSIAQVQVIVRIALSELPDLISDGPLPDGILTGLANCLDTVEQMTGPSPTDTAVH